MNPVVAVIAPGMMGAAVGGRLVENGLKVLTSLTGRSAETADARQEIRPHGTRATRRSPPPISSCRSCRPATPSRWRSASRRPEGEQQQAGIRRVQRRQPADRRTGRRRDRADRLAVRRCRHHRLAAEDRRCRPALLRLRAGGAALRRAQVVTASTCACCRPADGGVGDEDVLRGHHQGHAGRSPP